MRVVFLSGLKEVVGMDEIDLPYSGRLSGLLEGLAERYGQELAQVLFDPAEQGARSPFLKVLVDDQDAHREDPELLGGETVTLFLPIAGG